MPHYDATLPELTLPLALLRTAGRMGGKTPILEDQNREPIAYDRLILGAQVLGRVFAARTAQGEAVGVLLPNVNAAAVTIFGLLWHGRTVAMLNFTSVLKNVRSACASAKVKLLFSPRQFIA